MPILLVKVNENNLPDGPYKWRAGEVVEVFPDDHIFGSEEVPAAGSFYHISVTDKTLEEAQAFMQRWNHNPTVEQVSHQGDNRVIRVTSDMVSATGKFAFDRDGVEALLADIGGTYESHTNDSFTFTGTWSVDERDDVVAAIYQAVRNMQYRWRRWYVVPSGMAYLAANGGAVSGTAAQVAGYLRDGLLD